MSPYELICLRLSERMAKGGHKSRRPGWPGSKMAQVVERDGTKCHLCNEGIDMSRRDHTDPRGPSLDHIIPKSLGGNKSLANLKLAHKDCNARRGNTLLSEASVKSQEDDEDSR